MHEFTAKYADQIQGVLSGFDRLVFRGSLRQIAYESVRKSSKRPSGVSSKPAGPYNTSSPARTTKRRSRARLPKKTGLRKGRFAP
jgi:hypothetical protein